MCNDLPTVMLFTDRQLSNIVKFCCHDRVNQVSGLGVDVTFQLGPFYVLVTSEGSKQPSLLFRPCHDLHD